MEESYRIGQAAAVLGVRVETLRRWERSGKLETTRTPGGQRLVPASEVARLLSERTDRTPPIVAQSTRNRFPGTIVEVKKGDVAATVEIVAGPHRILSLVTREAVDQLGLKPGMQAIAVVKATSVMVELPE
ncbi:MAG: helix-turn-helix transcriptional regulator [Actinomycetota bacterium]